MSTFTWPGYPDAERGKVLDLIDLFGEKTTRDELGLTFAWKCLRVKRGRWLTPFPHRCDGGFSARRVDSPYAVRLITSLPDGDEGTVLLCPIGPHFLRPHCNSGRRRCLLPFNRINRFYVGAFQMSEKFKMTIDERNEELNEALTTRLEQLKAVIENQESQFKTMRLACDAKHAYRSEAIEDDQRNCIGEINWYVGMIKLKGGWWLCYAKDREHYSWPGESIDWKPLVDCSIEERIDAVPHIGALREAIVKSKESLVPELEKAIETVAKLTK